MAQTSEGWDEGDPPCRELYKELAAAESYELDEAFLKSFIGLSEALTGIKPLDKRIDGPLRETRATLSIQAHAPRTTQRARLRIL